ncbi:RagB/SusD family nutrient uptake outer membrane protein [Parabacteroides sp. OttesenSCG-928-G07]|nr:RagB/SusD family nutrient uptake outer membrane protein [Parabacteroides sp. OttesenSCG-928-G07]
MASIYKNVFTGVRGATTWYIPINALSDDCYAGSAFTDSDNMQQFANYNIVTTNSTVKTLYQNYYRLIYWCNLIILKIEPTTDVKKQVIAEAKAIRAFCHMDLIRLWGTPVLVEGARMLFSGRSPGAASIVATPLVITTIMGSAFFWAIKLSII